MSLYKGTNLISGHQVLYSTTGSNTDGAMTQDATTQAINSVKRNIDQIATDLNTKADTDGSNMVSSVKNFDGQWVFFSSPVTVSTATAVNTYSYDVSGSLPNDNYNYECFIGGGAKFYDNTAITIGSDITNGMYFDFFQLNQNSGYQRNTIILPVGTGRIIKVAINGNALATNHIYMFGYRRIGTNA